MIKVKDMDSNERREIVEDVGVILDKTNYFAFQADHILTVEEMAIFQVANAAMGIVYEKIKRRMKVKC